MTLEEITAKLAEIETRLEPTFTWSYTRIKIYRDGSGAIVISPRFDKIQLAKFRNLSEIERAINEAIIMPIETISETVYRRQARRIARENKES